MDINDMITETRSSWHASSSNGFDGREVELLYAALGMGSETGELENLVKKRFRKKYYVDGHSIEEKEAMDKIGDELADVLYYTFRVADILAIDVSAAFMKKMEENKKRYNNTTQATQATQTTQATQE